MELQKSCSTYLLGPISTNLLKIIVISEELIGAPFSKLCWMISGHKVCEMWADPLAGRRETVVNGSTRHDPPDAKSNSK